MAIIYERKTHIFTLHTEHSTYQMKVDAFGYLLHLYYGGRIPGSMESVPSMDYLLTYYDRGFSGNPSAAGLDRTYSLDVLPQGIRAWGRVTSAAAPSPSATETVRRAAACTM